MRISTAQIYDLGVAAIGRQQSQLVHTQQQVAAGKRLITASDDPVAAAQAVTVNAAKATLGQYQANIGAAQDALSLNDVTMGQVTDLLQNVRTLVIKAGDAGLNDSDRASLATEAQGWLEQLVGLANSRDGDGRYMFAGFAVNVQPFAATATGATYSGDQGTRTLEVSTGRAMAVGIDGSALFEQVRNGNGQFVATAAATNTGTGVIGPGTVVNPAAITGDTYALQFTGANTYDVFDVSTSTTVSVGNAYTGGAAITVAGMQVQVSRAPAMGDAFTLAPSTAQSMFTTVQSLIATLRTPGAGTGGTAIQNGLNAALANIDQGLDNVLTVRAGMGSSLNELDALTDGNADRALQYDQTLSHLTDLDYNQALSDFSRQQLALEAAQKSFAQVSGLSLFSYL